MSSKLDRYIPLVEFLGAALGKHCEVVLHDVTTPENSIIAIANGEMSGREVGGPITDFALKVLKQGKVEGKDFIANYHGKRMDNAICRSSSYFIHEGEQIIGILCINMDVSPYIRMKKMLEHDILGDNPVDIDGEQNGSVLENFNGTIDSVIDNLIEKELGRFAIPADRLSLEERMSIVENLNENGLFLLKGGVTALAERLGVSEPTMYRYLSKVKK